MLRCWEGLGRGRKGCFYGECCFVTFHVVSGECWRNWKFYVDFFFSWGMNCEDVLSITVMAIEGSIRLLFF